MLLKKTYLFNRIWVQTKTFNHIYIKPLKRKIRKVFDYCNCGCDIFVDCRKAFETLDHNILLKRLVR